jgi:hypothetical protein
MSASDLIFMFHPFHKKLEGIPNKHRIYPHMQHYFFSGAGFSAAGFSAAGFSGAAGSAFFSSGGGVGFASSFGGAGFGGSADGPQPISDTPAIKTIAIINTTSFFINFHLLSY